MFGMGGQEMGLLFLIILLIFGPSQIPKMARGLGQAMREFRKAQREITDEIQRDEPPADKGEKPAG
ncbi:MAG: twin-arginine translocase TatA/TatE family subunit [Candidatus Eisenbacteria bacterium]|uniref:Sec-independent protein translocase protein TatA n=1 Tax=Eiseniibacteriota bacterium TaxID=2212470 RepID=A0A538U3W6_UNCEI|nr:MAG: twin-arginine translocase TatA/TatE family subunit [Candidatus Eisenbacteria bacterium]